MSTVDTQSPVRPYMTIFLLVSVIFGVGGAIVYEALTDPSITLSDSQVFNIYLGAVLGFVGSAIIFLYGKPQTV